MEKGKLTFQISFVTGCPGFHNPLCHRVSVDKAPKKQSQSLAMMMMCVNLPSFS